MEIIIVTILILNFLVLLCIGYLFYFTFAKVFDYGILYKNIESIKICMESFDTMPLVREAKKLHYHYTTVEEEFRQSHNSYSNILKEEVIKQSAKNNRDFVIDERLGLSLRDRCEKLCMSNKMYKNVEDFKQTYSDFISGKIKYQEASKSVPFSRPWQVNETEVDEIVKSMKEDLKKSWSEGRLDFLQENSE